METLGERIKALRNKHNLSMGTLANRLEVAIYDKDTGDLVSYRKPKSATISNIEKNKNRPSIDLTIAIANYFDVSLDWMLTGKEYEPSTVKLVSTYNKRIDEQNFFDKRLLEVAKKINP